MPSLALLLDHPRGLHGAEGRLPHFPGEHRGPGKPRDLPQVTLLGAKHLRAELISEISLCGFPGNQAVAQLRAAKEGHTRSGLDRDHLLHPQSNPSRSVT